MAFGRGDPGGNRRVDSDHRRTRWPVSEATGPHGLLSTSVRPPVRPVHAQRGMDRPLIGSSGRSGMRQSATLTAPLLLLTLVLGAAAAPAQAQDDLLHRGSQARLDPPAADLTATAVNKTRRRVERSEERRVGRESGSK